MKIEQQVCSLELAKKLKELGAEQESLFHWVSTNGEDYGLSQLRLSSRPNGNISAYTVAELGEMLPWDMIVARNIDKEWHYQWQADGYTDNDARIWTDKNEAEARAKMIIYLAENKYITL